MDKKISEIETLFKNKKICKYNITRQEQKNLFFKFAGNNISSETKNINLLLISFEKDHKISEFSVSSGCGINKINQIIDLCLQNACAGELKEASNIKFTNFKILYDEFNSNNYISWLKKELNSLLENLDFCFNLVYTIDVSKITRTSHEGYDNTTYKCLSTCGIMDTQKFSRNAFIDNYFINSHLSNSLISKVGIGAKQNGKQ